MTTKVETRGLLQRLGGALRGIIVGLLMLVVSIPLLFWNEWSAVSAYQALQEGAGLVVSVPSDRVDKSDEGRLVHVVGEVTVPSDLRDPAYGVTAEGAMRLKRRVEMYQWKETSRTETRKKTGGSEEKVTTYSYDKVWSPTLIDSSSFQDAAHVNPKRFPQQGGTFDQTTASLGAFRLDPDLIARFDNFEPVAVDASILQGLPPAQAAGLLAREGGLYAGRDPGSPAIGDLWIRFEQAPAGTATVVAMQKGDGFAPYVTRNGRELSYLRTHAASADDIFSDAISGNTLATWLLRLVGFGLVFGGLRLLFGPVEVLADIVPFVGRLVGAGVTAVSFLIAAPVTLLVVAVAWIVARPLLGLALLLGVALLTGALVAVVVKARSPQGAQAAA